MIMNTFINTSQVTHVGPADIIITCECGQTFTGQITEMMDLDAAETAIADQNGWDFGMCPECADQNNESNKADDEVKRSREAV